MVIFILLIVSLYIKLFVSIDIKKKEFLGPKGHNDIELSIPIY